MFNLEQSIVEWRKHMLAADIQHPEVLDELESHLREHVARQIAAGVTPELAFRTAVEQIGDAGSLRSEFAKNGETKRALWRKFKFGLAKFLGIWPGPIPELDNFTLNAREVLDQAQTEAEGFHHDFIGTEHVLLGLFRDQKGFAREALRRMGVDHETVRKEIEKWVGAGPQRDAVGAIPYTPRARKALTLAASEARSLKCADVGSEHILLGLLLEGNGVAALVLRSLGVDVEKTRREILREIN